MGHMGHEASAAAALGLYKPRRPQASPLFRLVSDHVRRLQPVSDERFAREYGPCRRAHHHRRDPHADGRTGVGRRHRGRLADPPLARPLAPAPAPPCHRRRLPSRRDVRVVARARHRAPERLTYDRAATTVTYRSDKSVAGPTGRPATRANGRSTPPGPHACSWRGVKRRAILPRPRFKILSRRAALYVSRLSLCAGH